MAATPATVKRLAEELITAVTGLTAQEDPDNFGLCREFALRNFKGYKFGRTNQFDVQSKLSGLEEKFLIHSRDDLALALRTRLSELPTTPFTPEILSLFLLLSDRPLENSRVEDLDLLQRPAGPRTLTWEDIVAEDPLVGPEWEVNVDNGSSGSEWGEGSDEDVWDHSEPEQRKRKASWEEEEGEYVGRGKSIEGFVIKADTVGLEELKGAQYWDVGQRIKPEEDAIDVSLGSGGVSGISIISEVQAVREVLFMLFGHPCVLFQSEAGTVSVETPTLGTQFALRHTSLHAFKAMLGWYADNGTKLNQIRAFAAVGNAQVSAEQQMFTSVVAGKLTLLDTQLIDIEQRFVGDTTTNQTASLLSLQAELEPLLRPYILLSSIISAITQPPAPLPQTTLATAHLEHLFTSACTLQSLNDHTTFTFMTSLLFSCLQTYLRPIRAWMERGELHADKVFLVEQTRAHDEVELGGLWQDQFALRRDEGGTLQAPKFVHKAAQRIFITGKSVVFLKRLAEHNLPSAMLETEAANAARDQELVVADEDSLAPFQDVFAAAFEKWINDRHHSVSSRLRDILYRDCGLWKSLDALECVYLGSNGYLFDLLAGQVFEKIDKCVETWGDRFLLTEMVQGVYTSVPSVEAVRLRMRGRMQGNATLREARKSVKMLKGVEVDYALPWPIMNIITRSSLRGYKSIHTLLLQIRRAQYCLKRLSTLKVYFRILRKSGEGEVYYSLKERLLWFANTIYYYVTAQILLPRVREMRRGMKGAVDVDGMVGVHERFVGGVVEGCLLGPKLAPIHQTIISLLDLAVTFSDAHISRANHLLSNDPNTPQYNPPAPRTSNNTKTHNANRKTSNTNTTNPDPDSSDGEDEPEEDAFDDTTDTEGHKRRMVAASVRFNAMLDFVKAGLRGVARAGVMPHLETLAEGLDGVGWEGRYG